MHPPGSRRSIRWVRLAGLLLAGLASCLLGGILLLRWWLVPDIPPAATSIQPTLASTSSRAELTSPGPRPEPRTPIPLVSAESAWPQGQVDGFEAKKFLLDFLIAARRRLDHVPGYTATLRRQERLRGKLGPLQTIALKVRHQPFSVYMKWREPQKGREVMYVEGQNDNKVVATPGGLAGRLIPRLALRPDDPIALLDNRHPVTDTGIANLLDKLVRFRELDLRDDRAITILDRHVDEQGRQWLRSVHDHDVHLPERPFKSVTVLYAPDTGFPVSIHSYDWPDTSLDTPCQLAERYEYHDLQLDAPLTALDFDLGNPDYGFRR